MRFNFRFFLFVLCAVLMPVIEANVITPCENLPCSTVEYTQTGGAKLSLYHQEKTDDFQIYKLDSLTDQEEWKYDSSSISKVVDLNVVDLDHPGLYEVFFKAENKELWRQRVYVPYHSPVNAHQLAEKFAPILVFHADEQYYPLKLGEILEYNPNGNARFVIEFKDESDVITILAMGSEIKGYLETHGHSGYLIKTSESRKNNILTELTGLNNKRVTYYSVQQINGKIYISYFFIFAYDSKKKSSALVADHVFDRESIVVTLDKSFKLHDVTYGAHLPDQTIQFYGCNDRPKDCSDNTDLQDSIFGKLAEWKLGRVRIPGDKIKALGSHPILYFAKGSHGIFPAPGWYNVNDGDYDEPAFNLNGKNTFFPENLDYELIKMDLNKEPWLVFSGYWIDGFGKHDGRLPPFIRQPNLWVNNAQYAFTSPTSPFDYLSEEIKDYLGEKGKFKEFGLGKKGAITGSIVNKDGESIQGVKVCTNGSNSECTESFFDGSFTLIVSTDPKDFKVNKKLVITKTGYQDCKVENIAVKTAQRYTMYGPDISNFNCIVEITNTRVITGQITVSKIILLKDAQVEEIQQDKDHFNNPPPLPIVTNSSTVKTDFSSALIIDSSGSMQDTLANPDGTKAQKLDSAKEAAKAFVLTLDDTSSVAISAFADNGDTVLHMSLVPDISQIIDQALSKINAAGGTNIGDGLDKGFIELQKADSPIHTALLLSDGISNRGDLWTAVKKYQDKGWPICTIGFGNDADEATLRKIASDTGCTYAAAQTFDIVSRYQELAAYAKGDSITLSASDLLTTKGKLIYEFVVSQGAGVGNVHTQWQGSMLKTVLITPDGSRIEGTGINQNQGRYVEGKTFQMLEIKNPVPGKWRVELSWKVAPPSPEQVNILVTEKTDVFARIHGLKSQYSLGQTVDINTDAFEVANNRKVPLKNATVKIEVKKPGEEVIRLIQAQSTSWTMYKDVLADIRRDVTMFDDGAHSDYHPQDGIFGGAFTETDKNGVYLITASITGQKKNGEKVQKTIVNTFQVGSIMNNPLSTSQTLHYIQQAEENFDNSTPVSTDLLNQPVDEIDLLQQGSDPLDEINQLLQ